MISYEQIPSEKDQKEAAKKSSKLLTNVYEVLFILLKEEDSGVLKLAILRLVDFLQLLAFPFSGDADFPWRAGSLYDTFEVIIDSFQIIDYISNFPWFSYLLVFYLGISLVLLVIIGIVYVTYSISRKRFAYVWPLKALAGFCSIFVTVLFMPLLSTPAQPLELFVSMVTCVASPQGNRVHSFYDDVRCWQGAHIFHAVMAIVMSVLFVGIALVVTLTFYEAKGFSANAGARYPFNGRVGQTTGENSS